MVRNEMIKDSKPDRELIATRNGLNIYSKLRSKKRMKQVTTKQRTKNQNWTEITNAKCEEVGYKCQWCGLPGTRDFRDPNRLEGHHMKARRFNDYTPENCYPCHNLTCHDFLTDHSIDVRVYPTKKLWEFFHGHDIPR